MPKCQQYLSLESLGAQSHLGFLHCTRFCCVMQKLGQQYFLIYR
jgi:hypothetical protein